jgi:hypothetical protein
MTESPQFDRRHDLDPRRSPWVNLLAGLAIGLLLGLLIGWVFWPVSWTNAAPGDLSAEAQAGYVSAVADAYVSARNVPARALAEQRLQFFGDEAAQAQAIDDARLWYSENQPDEWRVRTSNLNELASALELAPFMDPLTGEGPPAEEAAQALVTAAADATATADVSAGEGAVDVTAVAAQGEPVGSDPGWISWLLVTFTALLLIAGGLYMLRRLYAIGRQQGMVAEADGGRGDWSNDAFDASDHAGDAPEMEGSAPPRNPAHGQESRAAGTYTVYDGAYDGPYDGFEDDEEGYGFDEEADDIPTAGTSQISLAPGREQAVPASSAAVPPVDDPDAAFADEEDDAQRSTAESRTIAPGEPVPMPRHPDAGTAVQSRSPRADSGRLLDRFTAHYQFGVPDYDEAFNVRDGDHSTIIGACGMGVNIKDGILQDNPENVVALDIWLFDKVNPSKPITKTLVLVPRSAAGRDSSGSTNTLVAQPGARVQLEASHLILDCLVEQVTVSDLPDGRGIFRDVQVAMAVSRR